MLVCFFPRRSQDGGGTGGKRVRYSSAPPLAPTPPPASAAAFGLGPAPGLLPPFGGPLGGGFGGGLGGSAGVRSPTHGLGVGGASGLNLLQQQGVNMGLLAPEVVGLLTGNTLPGTAAGLSSMLAAAAAAGGGGRPGSATAAAAAAAAGGLGGFGTLTLAGQMGGAGQGQQQQQQQQLGLPPLAGGSGGALGPGLPPQSKVAQEVSSAGWGAVCGRLQL